jgi:hypothetical protein
MAEVVICDTLGFSQAEYNVGYIPANTDVVLSGLIRFDVSPDFPFTNRIVSFDSECTQIKFPGEGGYTNNYNLIINPDNQYYIPFRINLEDDCGDFNCVITYIFEYETQEGIFSCTGSTTVFAYNATCDQQKCLLSASEVYCNLDIACVDDICKDPCYQRFMRLFLIDEILQFKTLKKDWKAVNDLYKQALEDICPCDCQGNRNTIGVVESTIENRNG